MPTRIHFRASILLAVCLVLVYGCGASPVSPAAPTVLVNFSTAPVETPQLNTPTVEPQTPTASTQLTTAPTEEPASRQAPTQLPTGEIPAAHYITQITGHKQFFSLGCEAATALDWAKFLGYEFNEFEFQYALPMSDNPDLGFVGDVNAPWGQVPPYGYGVHVGPVAALLNQYGIPAKAYRGYTLDQITAKISVDQPVIAWVIGNVVGGIPYEYTDKQGNKVIVAAYEHVVIITGYNETKLRYMTNGKFFEVPKDVFLNSWSVLGNMVIVNE